MLSDLTRKVMMSFMVRVSKCSAKANRVFWPLLYLIRIILHPRFLDVRSKGEKSSSETTRISHLVGALYDVALRLT